MGTEFIGPHRRATITRKLRESGTWTGKRGPMRIHMDQAAHGTTMEFCRIRWKATMHWQKYDGTAATVSEAIDELRSIYKTRRGE